jgi:hypothetical protein
MSAMEERWLTCGELMELTGWSARTVQRKLANSEIKSRNAGNRQKNGKPLREYSTSALTLCQQADAEKLIALRGKLRKPADRCEASDSAQLALFSTRPATVIEMRIPVGQKQETAAEKRFEIIAPLAGLPNGPDSQRFPYLMPDGKRVNSWGEAVAWCAAHCGKSTKTVRRLYAQFAKNGRGALLRRKRKDKGSANFFARYPKAAWLSAYLYLECQSSMRVVHEAILRDMELLQIPAETAPSYETVRAWLKQVPAALAVYAREGRKAYRERMAPYLRRGYTDVYANQIWVGDHAIHDVEVANDLFEDAERGAPIRLRLSAMLDYRSRLVVGASWAWEGSSRAIAATMRRGIFRHGPPEHIYVDNGRDYKKVARGAMPGYLRESALAPQEWWKTEIEDIGRTGFLARLGIAVTHCIPHHPQSKHVERFFRTLHERFDKCWPTYTSGNPFTRPDATSMAMMDHRKLLRAGRAVESRHPLASLFITACLAWIEEYNCAPHSGEGMGGRSPLEIFNANPSPDQKPAPDAATLALLMKDRETRRVRECAITLDNRRYVPVDETGYMMLHTFNERDIFIAFDRGMPESADAIDFDGNYLALLQAEELIRFAPGNPKTQAQIAESFHTRRGLEKKTRETLANIGSVARANGARSPLEAMADRLKLRAGETGVDLITQRRPRLRPTKHIAAPLTPAEFVETLFENDAPKNNLEPGALTDRLVEIIKARDSSAAAAPHGAADEESERIVQPKEKVG